MGDAPLCMSIIRIGGLLLEAQPLLAAREWSADLTYLQPLTLADFSNFNKRLKSKRVGVSRFTGEEGSRWGRLQPKEAVDDGLCSGVLLFVFL